MTVHFLNMLSNLTGLRSVLITLVHSLWLGAIMALLAGIIIILTNKSGSLLRYRLLTCLLIFFAVSIMFTFYNAITSNNKMSATGNIIMVSGQSEIESTQNTQQQKAVFYTLLSFIETHADTIVSLWFMVICFKCIRLVSGLRALNRLKKTNILEAGTYWVERLNALAAEIGITKKIVLLQSSLAKIPMVIGYLKPLILFPIGILNALPADEVEAILLHELAHIKRNDFLINLLQHFTEIIFFFNPGVLWVSSLIKNERENCCDDIAIGVTHDKNKFIHALVAFQEYNAGLTYATTFAGSKNHLLNRVKRIITNNNKTLNNMEKLILASGIIIASLAALAFSPNHNKIKRETVKTAYTIARPLANNTKIKESKFKRNINLPSTDHDYDKNSLPEKLSADTISKTHYSGVIDGKKIDLTEENNHVTELYVDRKKIPADQYSKYATIIDKVHLDMKENAAKLNMNLDLVEQEKEKMEQQQIEAMKEAEEMKEQSDLMKQDFSQQEELMKEKQVQMQKEMNFNSKKNKEMMNAEALTLKNETDYLKQKQLEMQKEMKLDSKRNEKTMNAEALKNQADYIKQQLHMKQKELQKQLQKMRLQQQKLNEKMKDSIKAKTYSVPEISAQPEIVAMSETLEKPEVSVKSVTSISAATSVDPVTSVSTISSVNVEPALAVTPKSGSVSDEIIRDLEKANLINTIKNLSFRLNNDELIINGVKQGDAIHQKILKNYVKKPGRIISVNYNNQQ